MVNQTVEESIRQLKAEIIAQDWRISPKRAEMLAQSFSCLQRHFAGRKATNAMLAMATSVLEHIRNSGGKPSETIDFLKEAMAHVVEQYEDLQYDQIKEEKIFQGLFRHFSSLKKQIKTGEKVSPPTGPSSPAPQQQTATETSPLNHSVPFAPPPSQRT